MALKAALRSRTAADAGAGAGAGGRAAKKARHCREAAHSLDVYSATCCVRPNAAGEDPREEATIAFIEAHAGRKDKLLVSSRPLAVSVRADSMRCLTVPLSHDGPARHLSGVVLDAAVELLSHRLGADHRRNGRRVLLQRVEEQYWLEYLSRLPRTDEKHRADMAATAGEYLRHDMVFFPVNYSDHFFVAVLNLDEGVYQVLDSDDGARYFGSRFYELALSKIRGGVGRCMEVAGRPDVAGWGLRPVAGLPKQTDSSSCGLFALKCMELWDGEALAWRFSMDDVHALRTKLAEELVFWELNEMHCVKDEIESKTTRLSVQETEPWAKTRNLSV